MKEIWLLEEQSCLMECHREVLLKDPVRKLQRLRIDEA